MRSPRGSAPAAHAGRGGARRAGRARAGELRQLRRPARAAGARGAAPGRRGRAPPAAASRCSGWMRPGAGRASRAPRRRTSRRDARGDAETVEHVVRTLLRRWGVRVLAPARARGATGCRRGATCSCAAGGSRRAGRSAAGASSPASAASSTQLRRRSRCCARRAASAARRAMLALSGADPLNLVGILTPGARLPSLAATACCIATACRSRCSRGARSSFLTELAPRGAVGGAEPAAAPPRTRGARRPCLRRCGGVRARTALRLFLCVVLPLLHGRHRVRHVLVRIHGRVGVDDLAGRGDHVGGAVGILGVARAAPSRTPS